MGVVTPGYGAYLKAAARFASATIAGAGMWGDQGQTSSVISPLANQADAQAEAVRQAQFLAGPLVVDNAVVPGRRADLVGTSIYLQGDRYGYEAAPEVFVIGADEGNTTTTLTVLKRL